MQTEHPKTKDKGLGDSSLNSSDGADSAEAAQHKEGESEIGDRVGLPNEAEEGLDRAGKAVKPVVR